MSTGNVDILTANEPLLASLVRAVRENNLPAKIKLAILDSLPDHTLSEEEAAASQNMSLRTFQRRLEDEGTRFRALLDQTRTERAESLLGDPACSLSEVGYHCGFSEQASFSRAFKPLDGKDALKLPKDPTGTRSLTGGDHLDRPGELGRVRAKMSHEARHVRFLGPVVKHQTRVSQSPT